jgi:hypothetical protein
VRSTLAVAVLATALISACGGVFEDVTADVISFDERAGWTQFVHVVDVNGDGCDDLVMSKDFPNASDNLIFECSDGRLQPAAQQPAQKHTLTPLQIGEQRLLVSVKAPLAGDGTFVVKTYDFR